MSASILTLFAGVPHADDGSTSLTLSDVAVLLTLLGSILFFGGAAVLALAWAFRNGQFENFQQGAASIFGPDEPIGEPTDAFPGEGPDASPATADATGSRPATDTNLGPI